MISRLIKIQRLANLIRAKPNLPMHIRSLSTTPAVLRRMSDFRYVGTIQDNIDEVESVWAIYYAFMWMGIGTAIAVLYYEYTISRIGKRYQYTVLRDFSEQIESKNEN